MDTSCRAQRDQLEVFTNHEEFSLSLPELSQRHCPGSRDPGCSDSLVEVDEPDGKLSGGCLVPVNSVALLQGDDRLVLLVVGAPGEGPLQVEGVAREVVLDDLHAQVAALVGLDVHL